MLELDIAVPDSLILPEPVSDLKAHLSQTGAHWFSARKEHLALTDDDTPPRVLALHSLTTHSMAPKTHPNRNNTVFSTTGHSDGLAFTAGQHCGFMLPNVELDPGNWSCAIRFKAPDSDARTLMTLNPDGTENYVFLHQVAGQVQFKDQQTTLDLTQDACGSEAPMLVVAGMSQNRLWLRVNGGNITTSDDARIRLEPPYTLFIGCRSNRARLLKTLGQFHLLDLVFWPTENVLTPEHSETRDALAQAALWRVPS